jgi:hypothetical protein
MAQEEAEAANVTPQEALLGFVRAATGRSAWLDEIVRDKVRQHVEGGGSPLDPPDEIVRWIRQSRDERVAAVRTAKAAVDAGVMVALERRLDLEGQLVADTLGTVLDALDLTQDQRIFALGLAQAKLAGEPLPEPPAASVPPGLEEPKPEKDLMDDYRKFCEAEGIDPDEDQGDEDDDDGE